MPTWTGSPAAWAWTLQADRRLRAARPARRDPRVRRDGVRRAAARRPRARAGHRCAGRLPQLRRRRRCRWTARAFLEQLPAALAARVRSLCEQPKHRDAARREQAAPGAADQPRRARPCTKSSCSLDAAVRFIDWLEPLLRRESYLALLVERPEVQNRLLRLLGLARWPMRYLMLHPGVIDELADERLLHGRFDAAAFRAELDARHEAWARSGQADEESLLDTLRRAHHAEVFRTLVRDVEGHITRRAGRRRPVGAGRCRARPRHALGLAAPAAGATAPSRDLPSSPTASSAARSWATAATWTWCFVYDDADEADRDRPPRSTAPSCAS